jgi:DNA polymerase III subunit beta
MKITVTAGDLARALGLAAIKPDEAMAKRMPVFGAVHVAVIAGAIEITSTLLDFAIAAKAAADIIEPGEIAVNGAALAALATGLPADAKITITGGDMAIVTCGRSRYRLHQIPRADTLQLLALDDITGQVVLEGAAALRLLSSLAVASKEETRHYLNGALLTSVGDDLVAVATDGKQLIKVTAPAGIFSTSHDLIVPSKAALALRKLISKTSPDEVTLCRSKTLLAVKTADFVFVSKLIDATFPDYARIIPKPTGNTIEVERAELLLALGRLGAVAKAADQKPLVAALQWQSGGALELYLSGDIADDVIAGDGRGRGQTAMAIGSLVDLLEALDGTHIVLDTGGRAAPMRVGVTGDERILALQMPCTFNFKKEETS